MDSSALVDQCDLPMPQDGCDNRPEGGCVVQPHCGRCFRSGSEIADNRNLGFGYHIARRDQLWLFAVAITLSALQAVLYRIARGKEDNAERGKLNKRS
jgi:hypothetical protein